MLDWGKAILTIVGCVLAVPVLAQAPTGAFDGKYAGVSIEPLRPVAHPMAKCDRAQSAPDPFAIKGGVISGSWEGTVNPQGSFTARDGTGRRIDGQIQSDGSVRALYSGAVCGYNFIWRKLPG